MRPASCDYQAAVLQEDRERVDSLAAPLEGRETADSLVDQLEGRGTAGILVLAVPWEGMEGPLGGQGLTASGNLRWTF